MQDSFSQEDQLITDLEIEGSVRTNMNSLVQWTNINAIVGLISLAFNLANALIIYNKNAAYTATSGLLLLVSAIIAAIFNLIIYISLYKFSKQLKIAISENNQGALDQSGVHLKNYFMMFMISIVLVVLLGLLSGGATAGLLK